MNHACLERFDKISFWDVLGTVTDEDSVVNV